MTKNQFKVFNAKNVARHSRQHRHWADTEKYANDDWMKDWRKCIWNKSRIFLQIRVSELNFLGIKHNKNWFYTVEPIQKERKLIISFKTFKNQ